MGNPCGLYARKDDPGARASILQFVLGDGSRRNTTLEAGSAMNGATCGREGGGRTAEVLVD